MPKDNCAPDKVEIITVRFPALTVAVVGLLTLWASFPPCSAHAQEASPVPTAPNNPEPIVTDRPDFTESTQTVPVGRIQLEGGTTYSRTGAASSYTLGEFLVRIASGRRTELRLGLNSNVLTRSPQGNTSGLEDFSVGSKIKLADGSTSYGLHNPSVALILSTSLPTGAISYREKNYQPEAKLCLAWGLSERLQLSSNLNYSYASQEGARFNQFSGTLSFGYTLTSRVACHTEYFGFVPGERKGGNLNYLNGGFTYLVTPNYQLDIRSGFGMNAVRPDGFLGVGASHRW